jgi:fused-like protein
MMASNNLIPALISTLDASHLDRLNEWPMHTEVEAAELTKALITQVGSIFYIPFANDVEKNLLELLMQIMFNYELIRNVLTCLRHLADEFLELPMGLLSKLVIDDKAFIKQFLDFGGLEGKTVNFLLKETNPSGVIVDTLLIIGQLARLSKDYYEPIKNAAILGSLSKLLAHNDSNVRAKVCALIGNLCKHSAYFYGELKR